MNEFADIEKRVIPRLINLEENREILKKIPYRKFLDLAIIMVYLPDGCESVGSGITVTNEMVKSLGYEPGVLLSAAMKNDRARNLYKVRNIMEVLGKIGKAILHAGEMDGAVMYVISNEKNDMGATALLHIDLLDQVAELIGDDCYIVPSSIHEILAVPADGRAEEDGWRLMETNDHPCVGKDRMLSDNVYLYRKNERTLSIATEGQQSRKTEGGNSNGRGNGNFA